MIARLRRRLSRLLGRPARGALRRRGARSGPQGQPKSPTGKPVPPIPEGWVVGPPDFIGIGVQKAGTTWWWKLLEQHPDMPARLKETHWLTRLGWRPMFEADIASYHRYFPRPPGAITGEWTPRYMTTPGVVDTMRACAPDAKLLVMLRDPVERYRSGVGHWQMRKERQGKRLNLWAGRRDAYMRSFYGFMLQRYVEAYGPDRLLILQLEKCKQDPAGQYRRTLAFLGLREVLPPPEVLGEPVNVSRRRPSPRVLDEPADLMVSIEEDVRLLLTIAPDLDVSLWPNFAHLAGSAPARTEEPPRPA